jgi:hypothetical protein
VIGFSGRKGEGACVDDSAAAALEAELFVSAVGTLKTLLKTSASSATVALGRGDEGSVSSDS